MACEVGDLVVARLDAAQQHSRHAVRCRQQHLTIDERGCTLDAR
jgi:hypothetical protein